MGLLDGVTDTADHLAGSTDEAIGRAVDSAQEGDLAGVGDHLAGSTDEWVGSATSSAGEAAGDAADTAGDVAGDAADATVNLLGDAADAAGDVAGDVGGAATDAIIDQMLNNPLVMFVTVLVAAYALGQLFDINLGE